MIATTCPSTEELHSLSTGRLTDQRSDELLEHIRECASCRSELETMADEEDSLIAALRAPDAAAPFDDEPDCRLAVAKALGALALASEAPTATDLAHLPKKIGEYEIVRPLGRGGMGSVFLARHTKLGRQVALKVLASHRLADPRMRERFEAEMRAVGKLSHPNIVTAYDAREVDGTAVLVTEYIDGFDLGHLVDRSGPLATADACEIARLIATALAYTSGQGFVHRDVKPSNIMLSRSGDVKLLDLGLARLQLDDLEQMGEPAGMTGTGQTMGTADYVAPEQVADSRAVDVRADIYSLGCTLFKLLTGTAPFSGAEHATAFAKMTAHVSQQPPSLAERLPDAPPPLVKLVDAMLAKDPAKRPRTPDAVAEKLASLARGSDLQGLVARAEALPPVKPSPNSRSGASTKSNTRTVPLLRRRVPLPVALGGGLLGLLLGLCLGLFLKVEYPDGTVVTIPVPPGSKVTLEETPDPAAVGIGNADATDTVPIELAPLQFAVLVEENELDEEALVAAKKELAQSDGIGPLVTEAGIWFTVAPHVTVPVEATHQGQRYVLARKDDEGFIRWDEIRGNISASSSGGSDKRMMRITFGFDKRLSQRMREVSKNNMRRQLAIILDGRIAAAPKILSELGDRVEVTGTFSQQQITFLHDALNGLVSEPESSEPTGVANGLERNVRHAEVVPSPGESQPAFAFNPLEVFQGLWQVVGTKLGDTDLLGPNASAVAFNGTTYYMGTAPFVTSGGTFSVSHEEGNNAIDFRDEMNREEPQPILRGIYRFRSDGRLEIHSNQSPGGPRPTNFSTEDRSSTTAVYTLERLGDMPRDLDEATAMASGKDDDLALLILTISNVANVSQPNLVTPPTPEDVQAAHTYKRARENLVAIGEAFHNFHDVFGKLPGSSNKLEGALMTSGEKVEPFSWRVAILPFIGENELYEEYRFHEPWDSEHNSTLLAKMPQVYRSPFRNDSEPVPVGYTHYQGFVGENTALGVDEGHNFVDFTDGLTPTLLVIETRATVPWTKPQDLPFEKPVDAKNAVPFENQPLNFVTADGAPHSMHPIDWEKLAKLITRNGGESVKP